MVVVVVVVSLSSPQCLSRPRSKQKYAVVVASSQICQCVIVCLLVPTLGLLMGAIQGI